MSTFGGNHGTLQHSGSIPELLLFHNTKNKKLEILIQIFLKEFQTDGGSSHTEPCGVRTLAPQGV